MNTQIKPKEQRNIYHLAIVRSITICAIIFATFVLTALWIIVRTTGIGLSNSDSGDTISEVAAEIATHNYETLAVFNPAGDKLFEYTDYEQETVTLQYLHRSFLRGHSGAIMVHNHPHALSLSSSDLKTAARFNVASMVVVNKNYVYILEPQGEDGWGDPNELCKYYLEQYGLYCKDAARLSDTSDKASLSENDNAWACELAVRAVADEFNLEYRRGSFPCTLELNN